MRKIDQIRCLWEEWKAAQMKAEELGDTEHAKRIGCRLSGLNAALDILKRPSNKIDANVCTCDETTFNCVCTCVKCGGKMPDEV